MEGNLVRLSVEIDEPEFDRALGDVVRSLAQQVRVPGFRPGKVPRKVLEARMGGAAAVRSELGSLRAGRWWPSLEEVFRTVRGFYPGALAESPDAGRATLLA